MWIGDKITEHGIGNGISLIIFCGIVARFPQAISTVVDYLKVGTISPSSFSCSWSLRWL